jgi:hypothetical protein
MKKYKTFRGLKVHRCGGQAGSNTFHKKCKICLKTFSNLEAYSFHESLCRSFVQRRKADGRVQCRSCQHICSSWKELYAHRRANHQIGGAKVLQDSPFSADKRPMWEDETGNVVDMELKNEYEDHARLILEPHVEGNILSTYNYPVINEVTEEVLQRHVTEIYQKQGVSFKLNFSFGMILQHVETQHYKYFYPHTNSEALLTPFLFSESQDILRYGRMLSDLDFLGNMRKISGSTKWVVKMVCNIRYTIYKMDFVLGQGDLPPFITNRTCVLPLHKNNHGRVYDDGLCFFRCLAAFRNGMRGKELAKEEGEFEKQVQVLSHQWEAYKVKNKIKHPCSVGVTMQQIPILEKVFEVDVNIFTLCEDQTVKSVYKSARICSESQVGRVMNLNLYGEHLSLILNFPVYSKKYRCSECDNIFKTYYALNQHIPHCHQVEHFRYPGGYFKPSVHIFEDLAQFGCKIPKKNQIYPWFVVFDMEAILHKINQTDKQLTWVNQHKLISVALCSNIPGGCNFSFYMFPLSHESVYNENVYNIFIDKTNARLSSGWGM